MEKCSKGRKGFHPCCHSKRIHYKHTRAQKDMNVRTHIGMHTDKHTHTHKATGRLLTQPNSNYYSVCSLATRPLDVIVPHHISVCVCVCVCVFVRALLWQRSSFCETQNFCVTGLEWRDRRRKSMAYRESMRGRESYNELLVALISSFQRYFWSIYMLTFVHFLFLQKHQCSVGQLNPRALRNTSYFWS